MAEKDKVGWGEERGLEVERDIMVSSSEARLQRETRVRYHPEVTRVVVERGSSEAPRVHARRS